MPDALPLYQGEEMNVDLPIPAQVLEQIIAVLAKTRSGKSSVLRLLVEHLLDRDMPVCIVDPKGDWWGLKLSADGKGPGYPVVIFGGQHADVPLNEHAGAAVAELVATGNRPCLIDLKGWMPGARSRFWVDFASTLFRMNKGRRWLVADEFHNFAPKGRTLDPLDAKALHWSNRIASEGLGLGITIISDPAPREPAAAPARHIRIPEVAPTRPLRVSSAAPARQREASAALSPSARKILDIIHAASPVSLSFPAAAARAGISRRSSAYGKYEREVRDSGEVHERDGRLKSAPGFAKPIPRGVDPVETWASRLPPSYAAMLRAIAKSRHGLEKLEIAVQAGVSPTSSGLTAGIRELIDLALIEEAGDKYVLAQGLR